MLLEVLWTKCPVEKSPIACLLNCKVAQSLGFYKGEYCLLLEKNINEKCMLFSKENTNMYRFYKPLATFSNFPCIFSMMQLLKMFQTCS